MEIELGKYIGFHSLFLINIQHNTIANNYLIKINKKN